MAGKFIFASRVEFSLVGAPASGYFMDSIKSVEIDETVQTAPFIMMKRQPAVDAYIISYKAIGVEIKYFTLPDSPTYDFSLLPRGVGIPLQLTVFKEERTMAILFNVEYKNASARAQGPGQPIVMSVRFQASTVKWEFI